MKLKKEYIILAVVITALSLYLVLRNPDSTHYRLPEISEISKGEISRVEIFKADTPIVLNKRGNRWRIHPAAYLADADRVDKILDIIDTLTLTAMVSESKNYDRYGLGDGEKIVVKAWQKDRVNREFEVGKASSSFQHTFVRIAGDHRVYHAMKNFRSEFDQTVDNLRDKTVLSFEPEGIHEIRITEQQKTSVFRRLQVPVEVTANEKTQTASPEPAKTDNLWQGSGGEKVDASKLKDLLAALSGLKCDTYIYEKKKNDLSTPVYTIELKGLQGHTLSIFSKTKEDDNTFPATSSENDDAFRLSDWKTKKIMIPPDEILKKPEAADQPGS